MIWILKQLGVFDYFQGTVWIFQKSLSMGILPHHFLCDHTQFIGLFWTQTWIFGATFILAIWINSSGGVPSLLLSLIWISSWFLSWMQCGFDLAHYLTEGFDTKGNEASNMQNPIGS